VYRSSCRSRKVNRWHEELESQSVDSTKPYGEGCKDIGNSFTTSPFFQNRAYSLHSQGPHPTLFPVPTNSPEPLPEHKQTSCLLVTEYLHTLTSNNIHLWKIPLGVQLSFKMLLHITLTALGGVTSASPFTPAMAVDGGNPTPVCRGNTTASTCCRNDWILLTPDVAKYPGYSCESAVGKTLDLLTKTRRWLWEHRHRPGALHHPRSCHLLHTDARYHRIHCRWRDLLSGMVERP